MEDDYDSEYRYESPPVAALQGLDRDGRVIYTGTLSKVLFPALRVGYLVLPTDLVPRFAALREVMDDFPPTLYQAALADFLREGHFARHLRRMRLLYRERRDALVEALRTELGEELEVLDGQAGLHLVATLRDEALVRLEGGRGALGLAPGGALDVALAGRAARARIWAMPLSPCYRGPAPRQGFILGYGGTEVGVMRDAVRRLRGLLDRS